MLQVIMHYGLHFGLPLLVAFTFYKETWLKAYVIMLLAFVIDLDHLLANPVFDPNRCSIGFHPLHSIYAIPIYMALVIPKSTRVFGLGLLIHILSDGVDCLWM